MKKWTVNIEDKPDYRIVVSIDLLKELLFFSGQWKRPKSNEWLEFYIEEYSTDLDLEKIKELLLKTYEELNKRVKTYENIAEGFKYIQLIEVKED